jgi:ZIP family zinc transporter
MSQFTIAILLTAAAGLMTTLGSALGVIVREPGPRFMAVSFGFAAGVMTFTSFVELLPKAIAALGFGGGVALFFAGFTAAWLLDMALPEPSGPILRVQPGRGDPRLLRTGLFVAVSIGIHNFPEGLATFAGALASTRLGIAIAIAIGVHNISEGLAVAAPIYAATGKRRAAFLWSFFSGLCEPIGALLGWVIVLPFLTGALLGAIPGAIGGFMTFVALGELLCASRQYGHDRLPIVGLLAGMALMAVSLGLITGR